MEALINMNIFNIIKIIPSHQIANKCIDLRLARLYYIRGTDQSHNHTVIKLSIIKKQLTLSNLWKSNDKRSKQTNHLLILHFLG